MIRRPPTSTRTDTLFPFTPLFRSNAVAAGIYTPLRRPHRLIPAVPESSVHERLDGDLAERHRWRAPPRSGLDARIGKREWAGQTRSEEHTSELQSLMRISYAVFCLTKKKNIHNNNQ